MKKIALLGSTGSIGRQVLEVVDTYPELFKILTISANTNYQLFEQQMWRYKPVIATLGDTLAMTKVKEVPKETCFYCGEDSCLHAITQEVDLVFVAIMGFAGLKAVIQAIKLKKDVAIANKETLVAGGKLVTELAKQYGVKIIPVDSEHSAIWQALSFGETKDFDKLILTASGGAFRDLPLESLSSCTYKEALNHPNWKMGNKITVDCATMANKGFEVAEAMWLFNAPFNKIEVVIHRESIIHSMVRFKDGGVIAQMAMPDMKLPIALALTYPKRLDVGVPPIDFTKTVLTFDKVDYNRYPCFKVVLEAIEKGENYPCAVSASNEVAVNLFLQGKIKFTEIYDYISFVFDNTTKYGTSFEELVYTDNLARSLAISRFNRKN